MIIFIFALIIGIIWMIFSIISLITMDIIGFVLGGIVTILWLFIAKMEWKNKKERNKNK